MHQCTQSLWVIACRTELYNHIASSLEATDTVIQSYCYILVTLKGVLYVASCGTAVQAKANPSAHMLLLVMQRHGRADRFANFTSLFNKERYEHLPCLSRIDSFSIQGVKREQQRARSSFDCSAQCRLSVD